MTLEPQWICNFQDTVSVHRPGFYAHRFLDFCADRVFKKIPSREYCRAPRFSPTLFICIFTPPPILSCRTNGVSHSLGICYMRQGPQVAWLRPPSQRDNMQPRKRISEGLCIAV